ncbi:hypothetical protein EVAR_5139_1 [Eumeta japonica]|uniref:Uncharacterized protein n=1 Tax=Eumeta variegata TaxID=151549 RepID=A0A4C1SX54_EUMVA|nr:hypothetical protein EVAR_5139_1 [Eumeta japonica]
MVFRAPLLLQGYEIVLPTTWPSLTCDLISLASVAHVVAATTAASRRPPSAPRQRQRLKVCRSNRRCSDPLILILRGRASPVWCHEERRGGRNKGGARQFGPKQEMNKSNKLLLRGRGDGAGPARAVLRRQLLTKPKKK